MKILHRSVPAIAAVTLCFALSHSAMSDQKKPGTIGLGLSYFGIAMYQTADNMEECPSGLVIGDEEQFTTKIPNKEEQQERLSKVPSRDARSPDGANGFWFPLLTENDPVPHRMPVGNKGYGLNLDGTADGSATAKTCKHEKLKNPETGEGGIDNQLARLVGCGLLFRQPGLIEARLQPETLSAPMRWVIEVTGVDDEKNDASVDVNFYISKDPIRWSMTNEAIPFNSQRIKDDATARYAGRAHGKIVDGVLTTDPIDKRWPYLAINNGGIIEMRELNVQDMRLNIRLTPDGAEGVIAGYQETEHWFRDFGKWGAHMVSTKMSAPNMYRAMQEIADGHKDADGRCASISAAYRTKWVRNFIIHEDGKTAKRGSEKLASN